MGSTQQGQAVVEMVLVGSLKELERQTHTETGLSEKKQKTYFSVNQRFSGKSLERVSTGGTVHLITDERFTLASTGD